MVGFAKMLSPHYSSLDVFRYSGWQGHGDAFLLQALDMKADSLTKFNLNSRDIWAVAIQPGKSGT